MATDFRTITPANAAFVLVTFEGPDSYAQAGGLGARMTGLAGTFADTGYQTHVFFICDPALPGEESRSDHRLILHPWCQRISACYPAGVASGPEEKVAY